jgi:isoquinoline 1-oxidoreductase beta subunit
MLVNAAAKQWWNVPAAEIKAEKGVLSHASGKQATFGEIGRRRGAESGADGSDAESAVRVEN